MRLLFQDPATSTMEAIIGLHHSIMFYLIVVVVLVGWVLYAVSKEYGTDLYIQHTDAAKALERRQEAMETRLVLHGKVLEIVWTITPTIILVLISIPSFALLYSMDELIEPGLTLKAIGHQWYWSYEYSDYEEGDLAFDSYMLQEDDLEDGQLRLLEVDRRVWLPTETHVRVLVTATDVLHCWAVPSFGVKCDAVPGRLNQASMFIKREGVFYGQCSEICGVNHGFMPICIKAVPVDLFNFWADFNLNE